MMVNQLILIAGYFTIAAVVGFITVVASRRLGGRGVLIAWVVAIVILEVATLRMRSAAPDTPIWLATGGTALVTTIVVALTWVLSRRGFKPAAIVLAAGLGGVVATYCVAVVGAVVWSLATTLM